MNKRLYMLPFLMLLLAGMVCGAATFNAPLAGGTISGEYVFNVTSTLDTTENCSITATSALTGLTMTTTWLYNLTGSNEECNATAATASGALDLHDASDWVFTGTCYNSTGDTETITSVTGVIVDNTVPSCTLSSGQSSDGKYSSSDTWQLTSNNATSAQIKFGGQMWRDMSSVIAAGAGVHTFSSGVANSVYDIQFVTSDGLNNTACSMLTNVNLDGAVAPGVILALAEMSPPKKTAAVPNSSRNAMLVVVIVVAGYFIFKKK